MCFANHPNHQFVYFCWCPNIQNQALTAMGAAMGVTVSWHFAAWQTASWQFTRKYGATNFDKPMCLSNQFFLVGMFYQLVSWNLAKLPQKKTPGSFQVVTPWDPNLTWKVALILDGRTLNRGKTEHLSLDPYLRIHISGISCQSEHFFSKTMSILKMHVSRYRFSARFAVWTIWMDGLNTTQTTSTLQKVLCHGPLFSGKCQPKESQQTKLSKCQDMNFSPTMSPLKLNLLPRFTKNFIVFFWDFTKKWPQLFLVPCFGYQHLLAFEVASLPPLPETTSTSVNRHLTRWCLRLLRLRRSLFVWLNLFVWFFAVVCLMSLLFYVFFQYIFSDDFSCLFDDWLCDQKTGQKVRPDPTFRQKTLPSPTTSVPIWSSRLPSAEHSLRRPQAWAKWQGWFQSFWMSKKSSWDDESQFVSTIWPEDTTWSSNHFNR